MYAIDTIRRNHDHYFCCCHIHHKIPGFHLYAMLVEVFEPERPRARWYCASAYLAPALVVLASAAAFPAGYGTSRHCWLSTDRLFVMSFVGPVALVLAVRIYPTKTNLRPIYLFIYGSVNMGPFVCIHCFP